MSQSEIPEEQEAVVTHLAATLGETGVEPLAQLRRIVERCGAERALAWLEETKAIETNGGQTIGDGSRRRTFGGVYFRIVRDAVHGRTKKYIFPLTKSANRPIIVKEPDTPKPTDLWAERESMIAEAQQQSGKATNVNMTVIGKVGKAVERQGYALLTLQHDGKLSTLPKGIPIPQQPLPTSSIVYVGSKQWNKVKEALRNPEDVLIVEGVPVLDPMYVAITVFATNTTTKLLQQALKAQQQDKQHLAEG